VVKSVYNPPTLLLRQAVSALYLGYLIKWRKLPHWLLKGPKTLHVAAGAIGMGCIGFPIHPVWEVTAACNLRCRHCHAAGGKPAPGELNTEEGKRLLEEMAAIDEFRMLVFSGGEPLVRPDIFELVEYASSLGLEVVIASNGTLITTDVAKRLKKAGVCDLAIGLDGATAEVHEFIRGVPGCFERAMRGIYATKEAGLALQLNITVMKYNYHEIPKLLDLADELDAEIVLLYHLVPMGRGQNEDLELTRAQFASLAKLVSQRQKGNNSIIEPTCAPQYWAYLMHRNGTGRLGFRLSEIAFKGCVAGSGLCYIKPDGEVWPCPFIPLSGGNVRELPLSHIWQESEIFKSLKWRENLKGRCGQCRYRSVCGGCRGRAYAYYGDYLAEDPLCFISQPTAG
jgi:radical SAM protein with 4Fe4S-binding SPASM domain